MTTERVKTLLRTIHSFQIEDFTAGQLMNRCAGLALKQHQPLYDAIVAVCGVKPNSKKLGHTLKRIAGELYGQFRIDGLYSTDKKRWIYTLISGADLIDELGAHTAEGTRVIIAESEDISAQLTELIKADDKAEKEGEKQRRIDEKAALKAEGIDVTALAKLARSSEPKGYAPVFNRVNQVSRVRPDSEGRPVPAENLPVPNHAEAIHTAPLKPATIEGYDRFRPRVLSQVYGAGLNDALNAMDETVRNASGGWRGRQEHPDQAWHRWLHEGSESFWNRGNE
jgi:hypothetical protein